MFVDCSIIIASNSLREAAKHPDYYALVALCPYYDIS